MASTHCVLEIAILILALTVCGTWAGSGGSSHNNHNGTADNTSAASTHSFHVVKLDFHRIETPFTIAIWVLIASLGKLGFHMSSKLSSIVPESCLVILLGVVVGGILYAVDMQDVPIFDSNTFFIFLLPPIVLESGYFLQNREFFGNLGTILLYAIVGTLFNAFTVGLSLYGVSSRIGIDFPLMDALLFGTLIAAVDPVAVLAVFEEIHVNVMLYILVFGESLLNDAVTVVLYNMFKNFSLLPEVTAKEIALGVVSFFLVSLGGSLIGILWGFATAFVTKYTEHVKVIEPIFVFVMSYCAYLTAELFHFSGIMSIVSCAIIMKPFVEGNISRKSHTTVKYFMKMLSSCSETVIFMLLGASLVTNIHSWDTNFILLTIIFISVYRTIGVVILTWLANRFGRLNKLSIVDQFIMSYGGIRGAVSFSLALVLSKEHFKQYNLIFTTTITVVMFTVFVQGSTIKPLVKILHVRLKGKEKPLMVTQLSDKLLDHIVAGMEEISGHRGDGYWREWLDYIHSHYLTKWFMKDDNISKDDILLAYRKMAYRDALTHLEREGSGAVLFTPSASGHHLNVLAASALEAGAICAREPGELDESGEELEESEGDRKTATSSDPCRHVRFPDDALVDWRANEQAPDESSVQIELRDHHNLDSLIAAAPKHYHHRRFNRNNLMEDDDLMAARWFPVHHASLVNAPRLHHRRPHRKHRHHRKHDDHRDATLPVKQLSTIFEPDEEVEVERDHKAPQAAGPEDSEEVGISFKAPPVTQEEPQHGPLHDKDRKVKDHHRHKHHGRHHHGHHRDKAHEESEVPERLDRKLGRLPSFDEDGVIPDSRARDLRASYPEDGDIKEPPEINKGDANSQGGEKEPGTESAAVGKSEREDNESGKEKPEEDGNRESEPETGGTIAAGNDDPDEEEITPTTRLLDSHGPLS